MGAGFPTTYAEVIKELGKYGWKVEDKSRGTSHQTWYLDLSHPKAKEILPYCDTKRTQICESLNGAKMARVILNKTGWFGVKGLRQDGSQMSKAEKMERQGSREALGDKFSRAAAGKAKKERLQRNRHLKNKWRAGLT